MSKAWTVEIQEMTESIVKIIHIVIEKVDCGISLESYSDVLNSCLIEIVSAELNVRRWVVILNQNKVVITYRYFISYEIKVIKVLLNSFQKVLFEILTEKVMFGFVSYTCRSILASSLPIVISQ